MSATHKSMQLGFIGLGSQGGPIARRMVDAGYPLTLWARRAESLRPYADTPARRTASIAELGAAREQVGICVVDDAGVQQVCAALIPAMRAGSRIVIHATVHPQLCVRFAAQAPPRDMPLSEDRKSVGWG